MSGWTTELWDRPRLPLQDPRLLRELWDAIHERAQAIDWLTPASRSGGSILQVGRRTFSQRFGVFRGAGDLAQMYDSPFAEVMDGAERILVSGPAICGRRGSNYHCSALGLVFGAMQVGRFFFPASVLDGFSGGPSYPPASNVQPDLRRASNASFRGVIPVQLSATTQVLSAHGLSGNLDVLGAVSLPREVASNERVAVAGTIARDLDKPRNYVISDGQAWVPLHAQLGDTPSLYQILPGGLGLPLFGGPGSATPAAAYAPRQNVVTSYHLRLARAILDACDIIPAAYQPRPAPGQSVTLRSESRDTNEVSQGVQDTDQPIGEPTAFDPAPGLDRGFKSSFSSFSRGVSFGLVSFRTLAGSAGVAEHLDGEASLSVPQTYPSEWVFQTVYELGGVGVGESPPDGSAPLTPTVWEDLGSAQMGSRSFTAGWLDDVLPPFAVRTETGFSGQNSRRQIERFAAYEDWRPAFRFGPEAAA